MWLGRIMFLALFALVVGFFGVNAWSFIEAKTKPPEVMLTSYARGSDALCDGLQDARKIDPNARTAHADVCK